MEDTSLPRFLHLLTTIHGIGAFSCFVMAGGSAVSNSFREALAMSDDAPIVDGASEGAGLA